jgi:hypothetical protein
LAVDVGRDGGGSGVCGRYGAAGDVSGIYAAEALLFYVGAVLISRGTYTYLQMMEVLNLVMFTVLQLMALSEFSFNVPSRFRLLTESPLKPNVLQNLFRQRMISIGW